MKQKIIFLLALTIFILSFVQIFFNVFQTIQKKDLIDYSVYYGAVSKYVAGENPYQFFYGRFPNKIPFNYPPSTLLFLLPLKFLPIKTGQIFFTFLSLVLFWFTFYFILKTLKTKISAAHFLIILSFFNQTFPVKFTLILGQINLIVLGLFYAGIYLYKISNFQQLFSKPTDLKQKIPKKKLLPKSKKRYLIVYMTLRILSSVLFSSASSLKLFPLLTLPLFLLRGDHFFVLISLFLFFIFNVVISFALFKQYVFSVLPSLYNNISEPVVYDQSLMAFFKRLTNDDLLSKWVAIFIFLIIYFLIFFKASRKKISPFIYILGVSLVLALSSIGSVFSWQHHLVFAYPLIFILYLKFANHLRFRSTQTLIFLNLWLVFLFHFKTGNHPFLTNPFIASYQTLTVIFLIIITIFNKKIFDYNNSKTTKRR